MVTLRALFVLSVVFALRIGHAGESISSSMIVEMRQITSVSTSPDGTRVVIGICHPNPRTNINELSWVIIPLRGTGNPITLPAGEEVFDPAGPGATLNQQAQWSPDGKNFFYLRRDGAEVQLWVTAWNGEGTRQVTHSKSDLLGLTASTDPNELIVTLAPARDYLNKAEEEENRNGILYDDHVIGAFTLTETAPVIDRLRSIRHMDSGAWVPTGWTGTATAVFDIARGQLLAQAGAAPKTYANAVSENSNYRVTVVPTGQAAVVDAVDYPGQYTLLLESKAKAVPAVKCAISACMGNKLTVLGWSPDGSEIYYVADSRSGRLGNRLPGRTTIYAWNPTGNAVRLIHESDGRLYNLDATRESLTVVPVPIRNHELLVAYSGADQPPLLKAINLVSGASRVIFDPNTELRALTQGRAAWHTWPTRSIYPGRGIFVLPDDYQPGRKYPAVITSYGCGEGFLRGGGNDNVPEFVAAHYGFVAICVDITVSDIIAHGSDMYHIYSTMCDIVTDLIADQTKRGLLDSTHVGLSGQSLGANFGTLCILRPKEYAAAAFRHGSVNERVQWDLFETAAWRRDPINGPYAKFGLPDPRNDPKGKWDEISVVRRAREINTPTLFEAEDMEFLLTLPLWAAMHEEGKAVEMRVFPKETHALWQPVHQWANFEQQLDWFRFWLKQEEDPDLSKRDQYIRWNKLRELAAAASMPHGATGGEHGPRARHQRHFLSHASI